MGTYISAIRRFVIPLATVKQICPKEFARLEQILQEQGNTFVELANAARAGYYETELHHPGVDGKRYGKKVARRLRELERAFEKETCVSGHGIAIHLVDGSSEEFLMGEYDYEILEPHFEAREETVETWTPAARKFAKLLKQDHPRKAGLLDCLFVERG